jgi:hypothetical protein
MTPRSLSGCLGLLTILTWNAPAQAQNSTLQSVTTADLGNVVSAASGATTFRIDPATGSVTKLSGSGARLTTSSARSLVTVYCGGQPACANFDTQISVTRAGTSSGRAGLLSNLTVSTSGTSTVITSTLSTGNTLTFNIDPFGRRTSTSLWIGFDMPINGNDSGSSTGSASAGFVISTAKTNNGSITSTMSGQALANVFRSLAISTASALSFGRISRPRSGSGSVSLSPTTGAVSVSGLGVVLLNSSTTSAAAFNITGEGGQAVSLTVPPSFVMAGTSGSITVLTNPTINGAQVLSGTLGTAGSLPLKVGGSFSLSASTPAQSYSGVISVTVQYN